MPRTLRIPKPVMLDDGKVVAEGSIPDAAGNVAVPAAIPAAAPLAPALAPALAPVSEVQVDGGDKVGASSRTGQVSEGELELSRSVAKRLGWIPLEEWKRDPAKHKDAPEFLEETPRHLESLREQNRRMGQAAEAVIEDAKRQAREEARAELKAATEAQDVNAAEAAARKLADNSGPPPQTLAWIGRNPWFNSDQEARGIAVGAIRRAEAAGLSIEDQLEAGEIAARKRFPEHFETAPTPSQREAPKPEVRLSEVRPAPQVQQGTRTVATPASKEKGFADLPQGARQDYERHLARHFRNRFSSEDDARTAYAKKYWAETE